MLAEREEVRIGRKAPRKSLQQLARKHTETALHVVLGVMHNEKTPPAVKIQAAGMVLDRGWGKPAQVVIGDEERPLQVQHQESEFVRRLAFMLLRNERTPQQLEVLDAEHVEVEEAESDNT